MSCCHLTQLWPLLLEPLSLPRTSFQFWPTPWFLTVPFPSSSQDSPGESVTTPNVGVPPSRRPRGRHSPHPTEGGAAVGAGATGAPGSCPCTPPWNTHRPHRRSYLLTLLQVGASHICGFWSPIPTLAHSHESLAHSPLPSRAIAHTRALVQPVFCTLSPPTPPLPIPHLLFHTFTFSSSHIPRSVQSLSGQ